MSPVISYSFVGLPKAKSQASNLACFSLKLSKAFENRKLLKSLPAETSAPPLASELFEAVAALLRLSTPAVILLRGLFVNNPHVYFDAYLENTTLVTDCHVYCCRERTCHISKSMRFN